jgi:hypothetical protein
MWSPNLGTCFVLAREWLRMSLMLSKGWLGWKQFIRTKWARFGIKMFDLCQCGSRNVCSSTVYTGKGTDNTENTEVGLSGSIVMQLIEPKLDEGITVYLDNWYNSPRLYIQLQNMWTSARGRVRKNCTGLLQDRDKKALKSREMEVWKLSSLTYVTWNYKSSVTVLSNCHGGHDWHRKTGSKHKPVEFQIVHYSQITSTLGSAEFVDQVMQSYPLMCKTIKLYKKLLLCMTRHKNLQQPHNLESHESRGKNGLPGLQTENRPTAWLRSVMCNAFYILRVKISTTINPPFERQTFYHTHPTKRGKQIYQSSMLNVQQQGHQKKNTSNVCGMQRCSHVVWALFQDSTLATTSKGKII